MENRKFENQDLEKVVSIAKDRGYKVYTFQSAGNIKQIFIVNQENQIGSCSAYFGGITFSSVHKPDKEIGTGFRVSGEFADPEKLDICFRSYPSWPTSKNVIKYKSWDEYISSPINRILKYYEL